MYPRLLLLMVLRDNSCVRVLKCSDYYQALDLGRALKENDSGLTIEFFEDGGGAGMRKVNPADWT